MKTRWIKLIVVLALVFLVVFWGIIFWPDGTKAGNAQGDLRPPPQAQQTRVESLYQTAVFHKERDNPSDMDFRITADCCRKILTDHPNSPQAQKATQVPQIHYKLAAFSTTQPVPFRSSALASETPRIRSCRSS
jgi:hypothetical protein